MMRDMSAPQSAPATEKECERPRRRKAPPRRRDILSEDTIAQLRGHAERTGVGPMRLLRGARDKPARLNASVIEHWIAGQVRTAAAGHVAYVMARWAALPSNRRIVLTCEMRERFRAELRRTGQSPVSALKGASDIPPSLSKQILRTWARNHPTPHTTSEANWTFIMALLGTMPDHAPVCARFVETQYKVAITADEFAQLHHHRKRTGIGGAILLRYAADKPAGLTPGMISAWLSRQAKSADPGFVAYVLARYRAWP